MNVVPVSKDPAGVGAWPVAIAGDGPTGHSPFDNSVDLDDAVFDIYGGAAKCDIDKGFKEALTDLGLCHTFNAQENVSTVHTSKAGTGTDLFIVSVFLTVYHRSKSTGFRSIYDVNML